MQIERVPVESLLYDPSNARKHDQKNIDAIKGSLAKFSQQKPLVVTADNVVIAGNGTLQAAKELGWNDIDVYRTPLKGAEAIAFAISDNRSAELAIWDDDILKEQLKSLDLEGWDLSDIGFDVDDVDFKETVEGKTDPDEVPEVDQNKFKVERGQVWLLGDHRLLCGDSTDKGDVDKLMGGVNADFCFTSPPYSDQREYNGDLDLCPKHLAKFLNAPCDLFAVNLGMKRKNHEIDPYWNDYIDAANSIGHKLLSWNVWDRGEAGSIGNQTAMFAIHHEWIFVFGEKRNLALTVPNKSAGGKANHTGNRGQDGKIKKSKDRVIRDFQQMGTVTSMPAQKARDDIDHPARFPVELPELYINSCSKVSCIVFDPFLGSGSTLIACEKTNRKCFGLEIDPHYCSVIIERWQNFTGKEASRG